MSMQLAPSQTLPLETQCATERRLATVLQGRLRRQARELGMKDSYLAKTFGLTIEHFNDFWNSTWTIQQGLRVAEALNLEPEWKFRGAL